VAEPTPEEVLEYLAALGWDAVYLRRRAAELSREGVAGPPPKEVVEGASPSVSVPEGPLGSSPGTPSAAPGKDDRERRRRDLEAVAARAVECTRCRLSEGRRTVVFGTGDPDAELMFIGEGPGAEEDRQGLPFVGPAGQLLTRIIEAIGLSREEVYIANVVKCRPPGNRDPQPDELAACRELLEAQVRLVRPRLIVALGRVAAQTLLGTDRSLGQLRGMWHQVLDVPVRVTYHPAAILRNAAWKRPTWEDMQVVRDRLQEAASG
jgi:uracil-DNA glycosylase